MLEVNDIEVRYGKSPVLRGLSLRVADGEIVCIVGPNGAGKSTTLMTIAGELVPVRGTVRFQGTSIVGISVEEVARRGISLVPEGRHIFSRLTVEENLQLATFARRSRRDVRSEIAQVFAFFPVLQERRSSPAGRLSGGEQQQLAIARAFLTKPRLLMIDEPSLGLAPMIVDAIYELLKSLREGGLTLLVVEQSVERAFELADRIYVLRGGEVRFVGAIEELREPSKLEAAYFGFREPAEVGNG